MLCPHCKQKDLTSLNETNKLRHLAKCELKNPPKSVKQLVQQKLTSFIKKPRLEVLEDEHYLSSYETSPLLSTASDISNLETCNANVNSSKVRGEFESTKINKI